MRKAIETAMGPDYIDDKEAMHIIYCAGHWASTHIVLYHLGNFTGVRMRTLGR